MFQLDIAFKLEHLQSSSSKCGKRLEREQADLSSKIPPSHACHAFVARFSLSYYHPMTNQGETGIAGLL